MVAMYFPHEEYEQRWQRLRKVMAERGYEAAVVWGRTGGTYERSGNVVYLSNFYSTQSGQMLDNALNIAPAISSVIVGPSGKPELIADESPNPALVATDRIRWSANTIKETVQALLDMKVKGKVALVGSDFLPMKHWDLLKSYAPGINWVIDDRLLVPVQKIKSPRELQAYREGGEIVTRALNKLITGLIECKVEADAAADAAAEVVRSGGAYHMIPVSHGETIRFFCRNPQTGYSLDKPKPGDIVRGWVYGPIWQGYWLDPGRTTVAGGKPSPDKRELIEAAAEIVDTVIDAIKPGAKVSDVATIGEKMTAKFGSAGDQASVKWPLYGHGVGLFWEEPWISNVMMADKNVYFEEGMVVGVEAFLGKDNVGSAGFEQNLIVTKNGAELLTKTPMKFW